jgi:hypothetical protein
MVDMINRLAELPLAAELGTTYQYSIGQDVMGLVIERVSGKSLESEASSFAHAARDGDWVASDQVSTRFALLTRLEFRT